MPYYGYRSPYAGEMAGLESLNRTITDIINRYTARKQAERDQQLALAELAARSEEARLSGERAAEVFSAQERQREFDRMMAEREAARADELAALQKREAEIGALTDIEELRLKKEAESRARGLTDRATKMRPLNQYIQEMAASPEQESTIRKKFKALYGDDYSKRMMTWDMFNEEFNRIQSYEPGVLEAIRNKELADRANVVVSDVPVDVKPGVVDTFTKLGEEMFGKKGFGVYFVLNWKERAMSDDGKTPLTDDKGMPVYRDASIVVDTPEEMELFENKKLPNVPLHAYDTAKPQYYVPVGTEQVLQSYVADPEKVDVINRERIMREREALPGERQAPVSGVDVGDALSRRRIARGVSGDLAPLNFRERGGILGWIGRTAPSIYKGALGAGAEAFRGTTMAIDAFGRGADYLFPQMTSAEMKFRRGAGALIPQLSDLERYLSEQPLATRPIFAPSLSKPTSRIQRTPSLNKRNLLRKLGTIGALGTTREIDREKKKLQEIIGNR